MRLYFIRHGQSGNNALWEATGSSNGRSDDPEITEIGREQARLLADFILKKDTKASSDGHLGEPRRDYFGITHIYTSLMVRAVATAAYLSRALRLPLLGWLEIHECGGIYLDDEKENKRVGQPGKSRSYFETYYQGIVLPQTVTEWGWWNRPFEDDSAAPIRAQQVFETLLEKHSQTNDRVAVVSHGAFYMELMRVMFKIGQANSWFMMNNTGISRFDFHDNNEITLVYHNRTDHLPERLIT